MTSTVETPPRSYAARTCRTNGDSVSSASGTSCRMRSSRIMKFVALVSSSINNSGAPHSSASTTAAACEVLPEAHAVEKLRCHPRQNQSVQKDSNRLTVSLPNGRFDTNGEMSTPVTLRPSSARTCHKQ